MRAASADGAGLRPEYRGPVVSVAHPRLDRRAPRGRGARIGGGAEPQETSEHVTQSEQATGRIVALSDTPDRAEIASLFTSQFIASVTEKETVAVLERVHTAEGSCRYRCIVSLDGPNAATEGRESRPRRDRRYGRDGLALDRPIVR